MLTIEKFCTLKNLAFFTALIAAILILLRFLTTDDQRYDLIIGTAIGSTVIVYLVPKLVYIFLCQQLEAKLFWRLGDIWGDGRGPRIIRLWGKDDFTEELDSIEHEYGTQLTGEEREILSAAQRQNQISRKWPLPVLLISILAVFLCIA